MKVVFEGHLPEDRPQQQVQQAAASPRAPKKSRIQLRLIGASTPLFHAL
jgi:hypothetical protein